MNTASRVCLHDVSPVHFYERTKPSFKIHCKAEIAQLKVLGIEQRNAG